MGKRKRDWKSCASRGDFEKQDVDLSRFNRERIQELGRKQIQPGVALEQVANPSLCCIRTSSESLHQNKQQIHLCVALEQVANPSLCCNRTSSKSIFVLHQHQQKIHVCTKSEQVVNPCLCYIKTSTKSVFVLYKNRLQLYLSVAFY